MVPIKPKMLFVDDRTKRLQYALTEYAKTYDVTIACNVPETLRLLCAEPWDVVSLDHDLNGHDFEDPESPTCGMAILLYMAKTGGWPNHFPAPEFWIHSKNIFAAHQMYVVLKNLGLFCYYKPIRYHEEHIQYDAKGNPK